MFIFPQSRYAIQHKPILWNVCTPREMCFCRKSEGWSVFLELYRCLLALKCPLFVSFISMFVLVIFLNYFLRDTNVR